MSFYGIKHSTQIKQSQNQMWSESKQGCLCTVLWSEHWLKNAQQIVVFEVYKQLRKDNFSQQFWLKR